MSLPSPTAAHERFIRWHPRFDLCAVCASPARGFGWFDPQRHRVQRTYLWFCSIQCQRLFAHKARKGNSMPDFTEEETVALPAVMRAMAPEMERIGWDRTLSSLMANEMHRLIVITIEAFRTEMLQIATKEKVPF